MSEYVEYTSFVKRTKKIVLQSLPPYRSVHLSIRPEFGYGFNSGNLFGARVGVGGRFLDVSGGASYIQDFGTYVDLSLRFNLYL